MHLLSVEGENNASGSDSESGGSSGSSRSSSRSGSPAGGEGSRAGSAPPSPRSKSPGSENRSPASSRRGSNASRRSRSPRSPGSHHSGSRRGSDSPRSRRSPSGSRRSASNSPARSRQNEGSPARSHNSGSPRSGSRPESAASGRSKSRSRSRSHSRSASESRSRSRSRSRSKSNSRSRSGSPAKSGSDSEGEREGEKRKRSELSDSGSDVESKKQKKSEAKSGSESDDEIGKKKKKPTISADSDDDDVNATALFGDADDISDDEEEKKSAKPAEVEVHKSPESEASYHSPRRGSDHEEPEERRPMPGEEPEEEEKEKEEPPPETIIDVEIPRVVCDMGKELNFVKLPNFLSVETRPFDHETYEDEIDEEETLDEEGRARLKLKVENTIRWREAFDREGNVVKESNARFIRWSDGSLSLHLGSEIFDVYKQPLQGDHNHLYIRQGTGLQGQAVFRTKLTFRPHSTDSFTHKKMTLSLADRSTKTSGIKIMGVVGADPDANRMEMIKKEEERLRASLRRESKQRRMRERGANRGLSSGYLEPDREGEEVSDDEGAISLAAIKNRYKAGKAGRSDRPNIYSSDDDGSDLEFGKNRKDKNKPKRALKDSDESDAASEKSGGPAKSASASGSESGNVSAKSASGSESD